MNTLASIALLWMLAGVAWLIRGQAKLLADVAMAFVLGMLTWLAVGHGPQHRISKVQPRLPNFDPAALAVQPETSKPKPLYVGSSIGSVYHMPDCRYAKPNNLLHYVEFFSLEEARHGDRHPCMQCITGAAARRTRQQETLTALGPPPR